MGRHRDSSRSVLQDRRRDALAADVRVVYQRRLHEVDPLEAGEAIPVYPAVSYWVVLLGSVLDEGGEMLSRIRTACPRVQLKQIASLTRLKPSAPTDSNPLYVVLKDHNIVFVNQKITRSLQPSEFHSHRPNAKLFVMSHSGYLPQIPVCVQALKYARIYMEADVTQCALSPDSQA